MELGDKSLIEIVATVRADNHALERRVHDLESNTERRFDRVEKKADINQRETRESIDGIRETLLKTNNLIHQGQTEQMGVIHRIDVKFNRVYGYALGAGAIVAGIIEFVVRAFK